jgi:predicted ester cyclase
MSELTSRNIALMRRICEEMGNRADPSFAAEIFDRPEGVELSVSKFISSFPNLRHTIDEMTAEDDRVAMRFSAQGTHSGVWIDFAPTGKLIHYTGIRLACIAGDKVVEHLTWWDKMGVVEPIEGSHTRGHG